MNESHESGTLNHKHKPSTTPPGSVWGPPRHIKSRAGVSAFSGILTFRGRLTVMSVGAAKI